MQCKINKTGTFYLKGLVSGIGMKIFRSSLSSAFPSVYSLSGPKTRVRGLVQSLGRCVVPRGYGVYGGDASTMADKTPSKMRAFGIKKAALNVGKSAQTMKKLF